MLISLLHVPTYLSLPVDPDDAAGGLVGCGDEDGVAADAVHVDAHARLQVVQVDVAILGDEVNHIVLRAHLKSNNKKHQNNRQKQAIMTDCEIGRTNIVILAVSYNLKAH